MTESTSEYVTLRESSSTKPSSMHDKFKFRCDHVINFCTAFGATDVTDQTDSVLKIKLDDLECRYKQLQTDYENLMLSPESTNTKDFKENAKLNFNVASEAYYETRSQLTDILKISESGKPTHSSLNSQVSNNSNISIKVPPCDTEVFTGSYEEWPSFRDMFTAVYATHSQLTPAQKLYYLRNKTKGSAGAIVKRYPLCDDNFSLAWDALKTRFENKRVLVDNQLQILFNMVVEKRENSSSLQKIHSTVNDCLCTLKSLDVKVDSWDPILIYLISTKLPEETIAHWEQSLKSHRELPSWSQLDEFLLNRIEVVERISSIKSTKERISLPSFSPAQSSYKTQTYTSQEKLNPSCPACGNDHSIRTCSEFRKFSTQERIDFAFKHKMCNNCLSDAHFKSKCKSKSSCLRCRRRHHTLLHLDASNEDTSNGGNSEHFNTNAFNSKNRAIIQDTSSPSTSKQSFKVHANVSHNNETILLRTALVEIEHNRELFTVRALLDSGSQRTFLSEKVRRMLRIPYRKALFEIGGIGGMTQKADKECDLVLYSKRYNTRCPISAIVLPKVTKKLPSVSFEKPNSLELEKIDLADPNFNTSSNIDLILGNDSERFINLDGMKKNICGTTSAYNTIFGWVLSGPMAVETVQSFSTNVVPSEDETLCGVLRKFWETEEVPTMSPSAPSDIYCEEFYSSTTTRDSDGRYVVRLPFKKDFPENISLGSSRFLSLGQYTRLEKSLVKDPNLQHEYKAVLNEYLSLNHMDETSSQEICDQGKFYSFYLPHHAVVRPNHKSTKVRVVFNASRKSKSGYSLNDVLYTGPTLQTDLISTILNWRKYKYVYCGDIQKMYRQIKIHPDDRKYQRILFQKDSKSPIKDFELNTVTFGVNCAPFLAIRTLLQLANDSQSSFPNVAKILRNETYVDDILTGGFSINETINSQQQLISVLKSAGFPLKKIIANNSELLSHLPPDDVYDLDLLRFAEKSSTKTLGIKWNALEDTFSYSLLPIENQLIITKRKVLSTVAKLFDPAGWITPIIIKAKMLMQRLWLQGSHWDEPISPDCIQEWNDFLSDIAHIETIKIPRWIQYVPTSNIQIHGFCDASKSAYCACIYIRSQTSTSTTYSNLFAAKSKVAPLKVVSLPKLELNGALLLAKLVNYVISKFEYDYSSITLWSDSSIVLGWLSKPPMSWETYVANRTSQIMELTPKATWKYVSTCENPADLGTRGSNTKDLSCNSLWWSGPSWLSKPESLWPKKNPLVVPIEAQKIETLHTITEEDDILLRFSGYTRALRVLSYVFRFFSNALKKVRNTPIFRTTDLMLSEVHFVKSRLIALAQGKYYQHEYESLLNSQQISNKSNLCTLNPFLDTDKIMRINGRLSDSSLPYKERHPIILPGNSRLCHLYLVHLHSFLGHAECNLMCRFTQTEFYISRLKPRVKSIIHKCKTCILYKQKPSSQIMAPLPTERCSLSPPFSITGVDFAGPIELKSSSLRNSPIIKGYVSVFVCFSTKAIHLEPCSDLSSAAFEAAFTRFIGRRGLPCRVMSDNGRNFLGASRTLLKEFSTFLKKASSEMSKKYAAHGFEWKFIPPHAPHMGGLWEAAVKSFKTHFKKICGAHKLTFEEFSTLLARIEGILNSRPISAISEDPADMTALTPGHFLRGSPLMAFPELPSQKLSIINRWSKVKALHQNFIVRWKEDYLKSLQKRYKWKTKSNDIKVDDLVIVIDDMLPPHEWNLGRIVKTHAGSDGSVRVADVKVTTGIITRPIVKLCYLPFSNSDNDTSSQ